MNEAIAMLNSWLGIRHYVSLVDVHESCGVKGSNREILHHLRALVNDLRLREEWGITPNIGLIEFALNDRIHSETGRSAFELTFGSAEAKYFALPDVQDSAVITNTWLRTLNDNLRTIHEIKQQYQTELILQRTRYNPLPKNQRQYVPGDLVLHNDLHAGKWRQPKLQSRMSGPYEVILQTKNDVECRHLVMKNIRSFPVDRLSLFSGSRDDTERVAKEDADQFSISEIHAYRGNPARRTGVSFEITFEDGDRKWRQYDRDLFDSVQYEAYCRQHRELFPMLFDSDKCSQEQARINAQPITLVEPGMTSFISIRYFGFEAFDDMVTLPDKYHSEYVLRFTYTKWAGNRHLSIDGFFPILGRSLVYCVNHLFVYCWGHRRQLAADMVEVTDDHIRQFPSLIEFFVSPKGNHPKNLLKRLGM